LSFRLFFVSLYLHLYFSYFLHFFYCLLFYSTFSIIISLFWHGCQFYFYFSFSCSIISFLFLLFHFFGVLSFY
jgi:hypothetical protein